jgi:YihY family inner membrane protein
MSVAHRVPETCDLTGDNALQTLRHAGWKQVVSDAFVRFRAADGFSHAKSLAFLISLLLVQGVIILVGLAGALGDTGISAAIVRVITQTLPGPAGRALTKTVFHAYRTGAAREYQMLVLVAIAALITGVTAMGQVERALNRLYGIEQDRPTVQKYERALVLALTAGLLATVAFVLLAIGHSIGESFGDETTEVAWQIVRWPIAVLLITVAVAVLFRCAPRRQQPAWSWLAFGAVISVTLWSAVTLTLGFFFDASTTFSTTYGSLAGMVALLLWALLSSVAIMFGASVTAQLEAIRARAATPRDEAKAVNVSEDPRLLTIPLTR